MLLCDRSSQRVLAVLVETRGVFQRMKGLLGTEGIPRGRGVILSGRQVHTIGMKYPIDAVYLSRDAEVLKVVRLAPGKVGPLVPRARWVVELASGEAARMAISEGRELELVKA